MKKIIYSLLLMIIRFNSFAQTDHIPPGATTPISTNFKWKNPNDTISRELYINWGNSSSILRSDRIPRYYDVQAKFLAKMDSIANNGYVTHGYFNSNQLRSKKYADSLYARSVNLFDNQIVNGDKIYNGSVTYNATTYYNTPVIGFGGLVVRTPMSTITGTLANDRFQFNDQSSETGIFTRYSSTGVTYRNLTGGQTIINPTSLNIPGSASIMIEYPNKSGTLALQGDTTGFGSVFNTKKDTDKIHVFLIIGQSNAQGRGNGLLSPAIPAGVAFQYYNNVFSGVTKDPIGNAQPFAPDTVGGSAWPAFAVKYHELTGNKICFVPAAKGGSSMLQASDDGTHGNWSGNGALRAASLMQLNSAIAAIKAAGYKPVIEAVLMSQGESDAFSIQIGTVTQTDYQNGLTDLISYYRANINPQIPFSIFRTGKATVSGNEYYKWVRIPQENVAAADPFTSIILRDAYDYADKGWISTNPGSGGIHYSQEGYNDMGYIGAQNYVQLDKGRSSYSQTVKTGFGVTTPLAYGHFAAGTALYPSAIINSGVITTTPISGAFERDASGFYLTNAALVRGQIPLIPQAGLTNGSIPFFNSTNTLSENNSNLIWDATNNGLNIGGATPISSKLTIKSATNTSTAYSLMVYDINNSLKLRMSDDGFLALPGTSALAVGTGAGGIAKLLVQGQTNNISTYSFTAQNSASLQAFRVRDDSFIDCPGNQMFRIPRIAADPGFLADGGFWFNTTNLNYRGRRNGVTINFAANPMTTTGDIVVGGTSGIETRLADVATGNVLKSGGVGAAPAYGKVTAAEIDATVATTASVSAHFLTASATLDFSSTAAQTSTELTITVNGAVEGDVVAVGVPNASANVNSTFTARVSAADTVSIKLNNYSSAAIDPASGIFKVMVFK